jgi:hypothetical protein
MITEALPLPRARPDSERSHTHLARQLMGASRSPQIVPKFRGARLRKRAKPYGFYEGEAAALERMKALRTECLGRIAIRLNEA